MESHLHKRLTAEPLRQVPERRVWGFTVGDGLPLVVEGLRRHLDMQGLTARNLHRASFYGEPSDF